MRASTPSVSVVVPAYNVEAYLAETLDSILPQTMADFDVIVVDDGSVDATGAIAEDYAARDPRVRVIHQENQGLSGARNTGVRVSNPATPALIFLDSDDTWEPRALEVLRGALDARPEAVAVYGANRFFDETGRCWPDRIEDAFGYERQGVARGRARSWPTHAPTTFEVLAIWPPIATSGQVLVRRDALPDPTTPFEPRILSEYWLFWLRLTQRGGGMYPEWTFVLNKRERSGSLSQGRAFGEAEVIVRRKLLQRPELTPRQRRIAWIGHRRSVWLRLDWAIASLRRGEVVLAAKQVRHFAIEQARYLGLRAELRRP